jgi:hypothetical protein
MDLLPGQFPEWQKAKTIIRVERERKLRQKKQRVQGLRVLMRVQLHGLNQQKRKNYLIKKIVTYNFK